MARLDEKSRPPVSQGSLTWRAGRTEVCIDKNGLRACAPGHGRQVPVMPVVPFWIVLGDKRLPGFGQSHDPDQIHFSLNL